MVGSNNQSFESHKRRGELDRIMAAEDRHYRDVEELVERDWGLTPEEAEEAIANYHRVFIGTYMGETAIADTVMNRLVDI